jgi:hypothetical protein
MVAAMSGILTRLLDAQPDPDVSLYWCPVCGPVMKFDVDDEHCAVVHQDVPHPEGMDFEESERMH